MHDFVNLPPVYELTALDRAGALEVAVRLADNGADEGTLVWKSVPLAAKGFADLDCALILRPDQSLDTAAQLIYVAAVSVGSALAETIQSLVELRFRWPNEVRVGIDNSAFLDLRWAKQVSETRHVAWLVLGLRLKGELDAIADDTLLAEPRPMAAEILERFGKHFLADINRWAEEGFHTTRKRWLSRADGVNEQIRLAVGDNTVEEIFETIDDRGRMVIRKNDGVRRFISVVDFFAP